MHMPGEGENSQSKKETLIFVQFLGLGLMAAQAGYYIPNSRT